MATTRIAFVSHRNSFGQSVRPLLHDTISPCPARQVRELDPLALAQRDEVRVEQVDVAHPVYLGILHHTRVAVAAKSELGPDVDLGITARPGAPGREGVAREGPGDAPPAGYLLVAVGLGMEVGERRKRPRGRPT